MLKPAHTHITQQCTYFHGFYPLLSLFSLITDKKPQTTTFLIKFFWALFCLTTPSLKNLWLTLFDRFSIFRERENIGPFPRLCVCRSIFSSVGLDGGRLMSLPPHWVYFKLTSHSWSHWWIRKGLGISYCHGNSLLKLYPWKMKRDLFLTVTASHFFFQNTVAVTGFLHILAVCFICLCFS